MSVEHRSLSWPEEQDREDYVRRWDAFGGRDVYIRRVLAETPAVVFLDVVAADPATSATTEVLIITEFRDGLACRQEHFGPDQLTDARRRFDELAGPEYAAVVSAIEAADHSVAPPLRRLENAASRNRAGAVRSVATWRPRSVCSHLRG